MRNLQIGRNAYATHSEGAPSALEKPWPFNIISRRTPTLGQSVLGCIDADRSDYFLIWKRSPRYTECTSFAICQTPRFQLKNLLLRACSRLYRSLLFATFFKITYLQDLHTFTPLESNLKITFAPLQTKTLAKFWRTINDFSVTSRKRCNE